MQTAPTWTEKREKPARTALTWATHTLLSKALLCEKRHFTFITYSQISLSGISALTFDFSWAYYLECSVTWTQPHAIQTHASSQPTHICAHHISFPRGNNKKCITTLVFQINDMSPSTKSTFSCLGWANLSYLLGWVLDLQLKFTKQPDILKT